MYYFSFVPVIIIAYKLRIIVNEIQLKPNKICLTVDFYFNKAVNNE